MNEDHTTRSKILDNWFNQPRKIKGTADNLSNEK